MTAGVVPISEDERRVRIAKAQRLMEFGMRLKDVAYITPQGLKFFTNQSPSIDPPFG